MRTMRLVPAMSVSELLRRKRDLEVRVVELLRSFENTTGLVPSLRVETIEHSNGNRVDYTVIEVVAEVSLNNAQVEEAA